MATIINVTNSGILTTVDTSGNLTIQTAGVAAMTIDTSQNVTFNGVVAAVIPAGNTNQRPTNPVNGALRFNSNVGVAALEAYANNAWITLAPAFGGYLGNILVVGGGGAGGGFVGGGGGGGGFLSVNNVPLSSGTTYTVTVGAGSAATINSVRAGRGTNSSFSVYIAYGGGSGGTLNTHPNMMGDDGASGGGNGQQNNNGLQGSYGRGIPQQGNDGGFSAAGSQAGCGGGGAGAAGTANVSGGGAGGVGRPNTITGSTAGQLVSGVYYLSGGGGGCYGQNPGGEAAGGNGGGGAATFSGNGVSGSANTGGGGGGASNNTGGNGGSGAVVLSVPTANYTGNASVTGTYIYAISGSNTVLSFTSNGSYVA